jgi:hypothetical protein
MTRLLDLLTDPVRLPLVLALVAALARVVYAVVSRVVQPYPRARAALEAAVALLPDVLRSGLQLVAVVTGRPAPKLDALPPDPRVEERAVRLAGSDLTLLRATVLDLQAERDALARRVAELTASEEPGRLRPTVVPGEEPARSPDETTAAARTGRHRLPKGTLGAMVLLALATGCGSSAATGAAAALKTATVVIDASREVRRYLCHRALDPLLGDPRAPEASSGGSAPAPAPSAPPPEVPAPALPPIPVPAPRVEGDAGVPNDAPAPAGMDGGL